MKHTSTNWLLCPGPVQSAERPPNQPVFNHWWSPAPCSWWRRCSWRSCSQQCCGPRWDAAACWAVSSQSSRTSSQTWLPSSRCTLPLPCPTRPAGCWCLTNNMCEWMDEVPSKRLLPSSCTLCGGECVCEKMKLWRYELLSDVYFGEQLVTPPPPPHVLVFILLCI